MAAPVCSIKNNLLECEKEDKQYYIVKEKHKDKKYVYYECKLKEDGTYETKSISQPIPDTDVKYLDKIPDGHHKIMVSYTDTPDSHYIIYDTIDTLHAKIIEYFKNDKVFIAYTQTKETKTDGFTKDMEEKEIKEKLNKLINPPEHAPYHKILLYRSTQEYTPLDKKKRDTYKATKLAGEAKASLPTELKGDQKRDPIVTIEQSNIFKYLDHAGLTCWMVAVLMVLFTYKTYITDRIIRTLTHEQVQNATTFEHFLYNVLNGKTKMTLTPYENDLYDKCARVLKDQPSDNNINCIAFRGQQSNANEFIYFLSKVYNLDIDTQKPNFKDERGQTRRDHYMHDALTNQLKIIENKSYEYIIMDIVPYQAPIFKTDPTIFDICDDNGVVNPIVSDIRIGSTDYKLAGAIVRQGRIDEKNKSGGHYLSIVYDPILEDYCLIDKILGITRISRASAIDWRNALYLFYYPAEQVVIGNVIIGIDTSAEHYLALTEATPIGHSGGSYYNKYCSTRNEYLKLNKMLLH